MVLASLKILNQNEGIDKYDIPAILGEVCGVKFLTVNVSTAHKRAEGFIELSIAESLNFDLSGFTNYLSVLLLEKCTPGIYNYCEDDVAFEFVLSY